jgi:GNAT superfamily N-acetyltransferase
MASSPVQRDLERGDPQWATALPVLRELRPHLTDELLDHVLRDGAPQGLRFTALFEDARCVAVAGWRVVVNTSAIRKLYIDDLATDEAARSRGHGAALLEALAARGRELGCRSIELDSGVQRHDAHRFYLRERMDITAHHFARALS